MKTTIFKALALGLLSYAWVSGADAATNCPAFNTAMVDAAYMAADVSGTPNSVDATNDSSSGTISCLIATDGDFIVSVFADDIELLGHHPDSSADETELRTRVLPDELDQDFFTPAQVHACRGEVLQSFVWSLYCAPEVE